MITELTKEQIARLAEFRDKWISIGLSTEPANRELSEAAIKQMYASAQLPAPRKIVWCGSPLSQGLTRAIIFAKSVGDSVRDSVGDSVRDSVWDSVWASVRDSVGASVWASVRDSVGASVWASVGASVRASVGDSVRDSVRDSVGASVGDSVRDSVGASVWDSVRDSVRDSVGASVGDSVRASVGDSVWDSVRDSVGASVWASVGASVRASVGDSVRDSVWASVWDSVGDSVRDSVWASVWASGYGQHDANWLAFYEYFRLACGLTTATERLGGHIEQAKSAGWYLPHQNICWVSERHHILMRDERGRLHCESGPSVAFPDGWAIYAWHGVRVPEAVIAERDKTTVQQIMSEQNTEVRRVMRNLYGNDRFMIDSGATEVDRAEQHGARLLAIHLPGDPVEIRMMELTCPSTGSKYMERVPPDCRTALEGLSWRFNVKPAQYQPDWQT